MSGTMDARSEGSIIDGRYQVVGHLGTGGMAEVLCCEDLQLGRKVALKLLHKRFAEDEEFVERFRREASHAAGLQHPNVVSVYDRGEVDGTHYIAMEYVEGRSLKEIITSVDPPAPLPIDEAVDVTIQILRAARFAHQREIVHRDLKPHNVIVDDSDPTQPRVKVTDFGIARAGASDMTQTGSIMGTAQYLSPEQAQGHATGPRSDLYAIGVILYELVTGRVPFDGDSAVSIALKQVSAAPVPPSHLNPDVPAYLEHAILRALAKDPAARHPDADAFIAELEGMRSALTGGHAPPPVAPSTTSRAAAAAAYRGRSPEVPLGASAVDEPAAPRRSGGRAWLWAVLASVAVVAVIVGALLLAGRGEVTIPDVVGKARAQATQDLQAAGLKVITVRENTQAARDEVIAQEPGAGSQIARGETVRLTVSDGPGTATVPDVEGDTLANAKTSLEDADFVVRERRVFDDEVEAGIVISQRPPGGTVLASGSRVTLEISRGPESKDVPNVVGQTEAAAVSLLQAQGFDVIRQQDETISGRPGTVARQNPGSGVPVTPGSSVTIVIATKPETVSVPSVIGQSEGDAARTLREAGFTVTVTTTDVATAAEDGTVRRQSPSGKAERGAAITITVGRLPEQPDEPPATTTTPTTVPTTTTRARPR